MKFNFYISCENDQEARECIDFIAAMTAKREAATGNLPAFTPHKSVPIAAPDDDEPQAERPNVDPGQPAIAKIGGSTKDDIFLCLQGGRQPADKFKEHMKLLWQRGEVKFDGQAYYL